MPAPLAGVRVVDLSSEIAGPYCTKLLADAGADVLKVEHPDGALFRFLNTSERSAAIDHRSAAGRDRVLALAADADLVVESFVPGGRAEGSPDEAGDCTKCPGSDAPPFAPARRRRGRSRGGRPDPTERPRVTR